MFRTLSLRSLAVGRAQCTRFISQLRERLPSQVLGRASHSCVVGLVCISVCSVYLFTTQFICFEHKENSIHRFRAVHKLLSGQNGRGFHSYYPSGLEGHMSRV